MNPVDLVGWSALLGWTLGSGAVVGVWYVLVGGRRPTSA